MVFTYISNFCGYLILFHDTKIYITKFSKLLETALLALHHHLRLWLRSGIFIALILVLAQSQNYMGITIPLLVKSEVSQVPAG